LLPETLSQTRTIMGPVEFEGRDDHRLARRERVEIGPDTYSRGSGNGFRELRAADDRPRHQITNDDSATAHP